MNPTKWNTDNGYDTLTSDNAGVVRKEQDLTPRIEQDGTVRVLEDTTVIPVAPTTWSDS